MPPETASGKSFRRFVWIYYVAGQLVVMMLAGLVTPATLPVTEIRPLSRGAALDLVVPTVLILSYEILLCAGIFFYARKAAGKRKRVLAAMLAVPLLMMFSIAKHDYHYLRFGLADVALWQAQAEQGDGRAQYKLGIHYAMPGGEQDMRLAAKWCRKAAEQNFHCEEKLGEDLAEKLLAEEAQLKSAPRGKQE
jgi:hypothetical protein